MQKSEIKYFIVPFFIPHTGCPHTCIFCNQHAITGQKKAPLTPDHVRAVIDSFLKYNKRNKAQISFYGGTFLGLNNSEITMLLSEAERYIQSGQADSIRFSTRPDSVTEEKIELIKQFSVETIELGTQSMSNLILDKAGRGHSASDTVNAVRLLKKHKFETGLQLMAGLPGDTETTILESTLEVIKLEPDFVRIYPTIAFKGSGLEQLFNSGLYRPLTLDRCVTIVKKMYLLFTGKNIPVIRMGLQSSSDFESGDDIIAGPYHPAFGHLVISALFLDMARLSAGTSIHLTKAPVFHVNPKDISKMRGLKNANISVLIKEFGFSNIQVKPDSSLETDSIRLNDNIIDIMSLYKRL